MKLRKASADSADSQFVPDDFSSVIAHVPEDCALAGGQAVAWWAKVYGIKIQQRGRSIEVTSQDIDFWGSRDDLIQVAKSLRRKPVFPGQHEMTVWSGAIPIVVKDQETLAEFLHTIPGLDTADPEAASVPQTYDANGVRKTILVLTPISMVLAKVHCLRHYINSNQLPNSRRSTASTCWTPFQLRILKPGLQIRHLMRRIATRSPIS